MKQIKTIFVNLDPYAFDNRVNEALADGWELVGRKLIGDSFFLAELEKDIITEAERCCENCKHYDCSATSEPCSSCNEDDDKWEAAE
jgi:hypothetical protein